MKRYAKLWMLMILVAALCAAACSGVPEADVDTGEMNVDEAETGEAETGATENGDTDAGKKAFGSFTTKDVEGNEVSEAIFGNAKLSMVNIWATYCGPCLSEMPDLGELAKDYAEKGVQIIGIVSDVGYDGAPGAEELQTVKDILTETGAAYTHILPCEELNKGILDTVYAVPTTVFVDQNGNLVGDSVIGSQSKDAWEFMIDQMLELAS